MAASHHPDAQPRVGAGAWKRPSLRNTLRARAPLHASVRLHRPLMAEYTKKERAELRKLAGEVYEWELGRELGGLNESFRKWSEGKMLSSELSSAIHEFHQHAARELWSMYQGLPEPNAVAPGW